VVTIKDVAREARVSVATVSRVFTGSGPVSEETGRRVREIAARLRYAPHGAARSLITSKTSTIGVVLPDLFGEFFSEVIRGMDQSARRRGYHLLLSSSHGDRAEVESAIRAMRGRVDGLIAMSPHLDTSGLAANLPASLPVVLLNCAPRGTPPYDTLSIDNQRGAFDVVSHLAGLGHRRIAILRGAVGNYDAAERLKGYRRALRAVGLEARPEWEGAGDFTEGSGYRATCALLERLPRRDRPTAIFAANDVMAIGALSALHEAGVGVPDEIAVAGFDDIPLARYMSPPLTSVHVAICELGERAVETLLAAIEEGDSHVPQRRRLPTRLVIRRSCGGAGADGSGVDGSDRQGRAS
jgi:LacI family transcriptional regulator